VLRALRLSSVVVLLLLVAGCGGATKHSASNTRSAATASTTQSSDGSSNQLAGVVSACEQSGGSALLPGSGGQDASSLPDDTSAVCGCWTQWMASNLSSTDQTAIATSVDESGSLIGATLTDIPLLGELGTALSSCDLGQTPAPSGNGPPSSGATAPTSTGQTSTPANTLMNPASHGIWRACSVSSQQDKYSAAVSSPGCGFAAEVVSHLMTLFKSGFSGASPANVTVTNAGTRYTLTCVSPSGTNGELIECSNGTSPWVTFYEDSASD